MGIIAWWRYIARAAYTEHPVALFAVGYVYLWSVFLAWLVSEGWG